MRISPHDVPSGKKGGDRLVPFLTYLPPTAAAAMKDVSPETSLIIISGCPQQGLPPSNGIVAPSGGLRQDYSLEGSSRSGPNSNDSQQEGGILCIPFPHPTEAAIDVLTVDWNRWNQVYVFPPKTFMMLLLPKAPLVPNPRGPRSSLATSSSMVPRTLQRAEDHLHLRVQLEQFVRSEGVLSGFQNYKRWTAFTF